MYSSEVFLPYFSLLIGCRLISEFLPVFLQESRQAVISLTWLVDMRSGGDKCVTGSKAEVAFKTWPFEAWIFLEPKTPKKFC